MSTEKKSPEERINALEFYGAGDESDELFEATCGLCYLMSSGIEADTLAGWAEDQAAHSKEWANENSEGEPLDKMIRPKWGHTGT